MLGVQQLSVQTTILWITGDYLWIIRFPCGQVYKNGYFVYQTTPHIWGVVFCIGKI